MIASIPASIRGPLLGLCAAVATMAQTGAEQARSPVTLEQLSDMPARDRKAERAGNLTIPQVDAARRRSVQTSTDVPDRPDNQTVVVEPVTGRDRCDPSEPTRKTAACRRLSGARLGQAAGGGSGSAVSPEARLLLLANPNGSSLHGYGSGRALSDKLGLEDVNGPAGQLAGALRDQRDTKDNPGTPSGSANTGPLPDRDLPILLPPR